MNDEERKRIANAMAEKAAEIHAQSVRRIKEQNGEVNKSTGEVLPAAPLPDFDKMLADLPHLPEQPVEKHSTPFDDDDLLDIDFSDKPVDPDKFLQAAGLPPEETPPSPVAQGQGEAVAPPLSKGTPVRVERLREGARRSGAMSSPSDMMTEMQDALSDLGKDIEIYSDQLEKLVDADNDYKEIYAKTYLLTKASGEKMTVTEVDCKVTEKLSALKRAADIAEALMKATREHMDWEKKRIEVAQSILAFSRAELEHTPNANPLR